MQSNHANAPSVSVTRPTPYELKISLNFPLSFLNEAARLNLDLTSLGIPGLGNLVDFNAASNIDIDTTMRVQLDLGFDLTNAENPRPFIYDTTNITVELQAKADRIDMKAAIGPLGVSVLNGSLTLDRDGNGNLTSPAIITFGIRDNDGNGKHYLEEGLFSDLEITEAEAGFGLTLPMFRTSNGSILDPNEPSLTVNVSDFSDLPNSLEIIAPDFTTLINGIDLSTEFSGLTEGIDGLFTIIDTAVDTIAFAAKLPVIGDQLRSAADFLTKVRNETKETLQQAGPQTLKFVRDQLYKALGPVGLNMLGETPSPASIQILVDGLPFNPDTQVITTLPEDIRFNFNLVETLVDKNIPIDFDIGLPALGLELDGGIRLEIGGSMFVGMGISRSTGFYLDTSRPDDLKIEVLATIPEFRATGNLGFLQITAEDHAPNDLNQRSQVGGTYTIDLLGGPDNKLTLAEASSLGFGDLINATFNGGARLHLDIRTSVNGNLELPSIFTEFIVDWGFSNADPNAEVFGSEPIIGFTNTYLDAGQAINGLLSPVLKYFYDVIQPLALASDILTSPIPLVSEVMGDAFSLLRVLRLTAEVFVGYRSLESTEAVLRAIDKVLDIAKHVNADGNIQIRSMTSGSMTYAARELG